MAKRTTPLDLSEYPIADSSRLAYVNSLEGLDTWLKGKPINDESLAEYIGYIFKQGLSPSFAKTVLSAVRWRFLSKDKPDPRGRRCRSALQNFRRQGIGRGRGQVDGLTWERADLLADLATQENNLYGFRDAAVIAVMSDALLRVSEAAAIDLDHVDFGVEDVDGGTLYIPRSKTDQMGKGATLYIRPQTLEYIRTWIDNAGITEGPLFCRIKRTFMKALPNTRINHYNIRYMLRVRAKQAGIKGRISGHSCRVGSAQSLASRQATLVEMQQVGRWASPEMPAHYAQKFTANQSVVARLRPAR